MGDRCLDARLVPLMPTDNETIGIGSPDPMALVDCTYLIQRSDPWPLRRIGKSSIKCGCANCQNVLVTIRKGYTYDKNLKDLRVEITCPCCCKPCRNDSDCSKCVGEHMSEECSHAKTFGRAFLIGPKWKGFHTNWDEKLYHKDGTEVKLD